MSENLEKAENYPDQCKRCDNSSPPLKSLQKIDSLFIIARFLYRIAIGFLDGITAGFHDR